MGNDANVDDLMACPDIRRACRRRELEGCLLRPYCQLQPQVGKCSAQHAGGLHVCRQVAGVGEAEGGVEMCDHLLITGARAVERGTRELGGAEGEYRARCSRSLAGDRMLLLSSFLFTRATAYDPHVSSRLHLAALAVD